MNAESHNSSRHGRLIAMRTIWMVLAIVIAAFAIHMIRSGGERVVEPFRTQPPELLADKVLAFARPRVEAGQYAAAIELMQAYVFVEVDDVQVRPLLAETLMYAGDYSAAEKTVDQILLRAPQMAKALWLKGRFVSRRAGKNPISYFVKAAQSPDVSPEILAACGLEMLLSGDVDKAEQTLLRARKAGVAGARTLGPLGEIALRKGDYPEAEKLLALAVEAEPDSARLWLMLGQARRDRPSEAAQAFAKVVDRKMPDASDELRGVTALRVADAYMAAGERDKAKSYLTRAGELGADAEAVDELWRKLNSGVPDPGSYSNPKN